MEGEKEITLQGTFGGSAHFEDFLGRLSVEVSERHETTYKVSVTLKEPEVEKLYQFLTKMRERWKQ